MTQQQPENDQQQVAQQAAQQAATQTQQQARSGDITPQTLVDLIDAIPDKIVEAMKSAYPASSSGSNEQQSAGAQQQQTTGQTQQSATDGVAGSWGDRFNKFWFGNS